MTFADQLHGYESGIVRRMRASMEDARSQFRKRREFNRTYHELNQLSERELDDLGISRANIASVARSAVNAS
jgi:uncharacterized protein YjiS (DUF1127 family)